MEKEYFEEYLYVLDFGDCSISCLYLHNANKKPEDFEDTDELLEYWGFNPKNCQYMYSSVELELNHIILPLKD